MRHGDVYHQKCVGPLVKLKRLSYLKLASSAMNLVDDEQKFQNRNVVNFDHPLNIYFHFIASILLYTNYCAYMCDI